MIEEFTIAGFRCLKKVSGRLTALHAFIGPNDSGKTTLLEALEAMVNGAAGKGRDPEFDQDAELSFKAEGNEFALPRSEPLGLTELTAVAAGTLVDGIEECGPGRILRLDPAQLREPSNLIIETNPIDFKNDRGKGLAGVYDALQGRNVDDFLAINKSVVSLFPTVKRVRLLTPEGNLKQLAVALVTGEVVKAPDMSDGLLYYLAFAALPYIGRLGLLLVEEPENGLHPARIREVVRILREVSKRTQVVMATHSPLVVNELKPEEVSVVTRHPEDGTQIRAISTAANFEERSKVYALGELWLSYADGEDERPLFTDNAGAAQ